MTYYTHVNRHIIDRNRKQGTNDPVITIKRGKSGKPKYASEIILPAGSVMVYDTEAILPCNARCVIISNTEPEVVR